MLDFLEYSGLFIIIRYICILTQCAAAKMDTIRSLQNAELCFPVVDFSPCEADFSLSYGKWSR